MTLNQLIYFQTVAKFEHFRKAAEFLSISQPSLSHSIAMLEEELNIKLFKRNGRNIILTKYGKIFLERVDDILLRLESAEKYMKQLSGKHGHIDIAYVYPLSISYIPKLARSFLDMESNKNISFTFHQHITKDIITGLKNDKFDIGFCSFAENTDEINFIPIIKQDMVIITSENHPLTFEDSVSISVLNEYPIIGYDKTSGLGKVTNKIFKDNKIDPDIKHFSPDENAIAGLVSENFGISLVANVESLSNHNIKIIKISDISIEHTVYLAYKNQNYHINAVKNFINFIQRYTATNKAKTH